MFYFILLLVGIVAVMFVAERAFTTLVKSSVDKKVSHEVEFYKKENARLRMTECKQAGLSESTCLALRALEEGDVPFYILPEDQSVQVTGG